MTLTTIIEEEVKKFDAGCNTDNISDPPSDKTWIKSFLTASLTRLAEEMMKEVEAVKFGTDDSINQSVEVFRTCLALIKSRLSKFMGK